MDKERFDRAIEAANARLREGIGTLGEKGVHNTLKHYYEPDITCHEIPVGGYVADIVGENGIIEIQTTAFYRMREKLTRFLDHARVTIVWPCIVNKRLINIDPESGEVVSMRRSNIHRGEYDIFWELYSIRQLVSDPRLSVCIAQLDADEYRPINRKRGKRHKGANNGVERYPTALVGEITLSSPVDYLRFIPAGLPEEFTAKEFAKAACIHADTARCTLGVLTEAGAVERCGKHGNAFVYRVISEFASQGQSAQEGSSDCTSWTQPFDPDHIAAILQQPLDGLDGHMCAAIISGAPLSAVTEKSGVARWCMNAKKLMLTLDILGASHAGALRRTPKPGVALPECCIISEHGHFLLHYRGMYYDNKRGSFDYYDQNQMTGYIEVFPAASAADI